ncbi:MAG: hypothetical protein KDA81_12680 [Planctomycetaceae bacterium]|nr:hypothetical protein [Planctomycetaceae bacterium]
MSGHPKDEQAKESADDSTPSFRPDSGHPPDGSDVEDGVQNSCQDCYQTSASADQNPSREAAAGTTSDSDGCDQSAQRSQNDELDPERDGESVESEFRKARLAAIRDAIESGAYDTDEKLDQAFLKMMRSLENDSSDQ